MEQNWQSPQTRIMAPGLHLVRITSPNFRLAADLQPKDIQQINTSAVYSGRLCLLPALVNEVVKAFANTRPFEVFKLVPGTRVQ